MLCDLEVRLRADLAGVATVDGAEWEPLFGLRTWDLRPANPRSAPVHCFELRDELVLGVGVGDCRWELDRSPEGVRFVEAVVRAAVAGRVIETFAPGRSSVEVALGDGRVDRTATSTAPVGCIPLPRWHRWGRTVHYEPYA